ncbi:MAG: PLP-dependent aminotransferase family protein [Nakamurella sp.]
MTETLAVPIALAGPALLSRSNLAQRDRLTAGFPMRPPGPGSLPLNGGVPAPEALPIAELSDAFRAALADPQASRTALQYSVPLGIPELRQWIAHRELVDADRVVVTNGALHALSLTFGALIDPGDVVIVENPTFPIALRVLQYHNAHIRSVPVDADGLDVDALERALIQGVRPKAVYTIPDFHNPTGVTLSASRRGRLVQLAERYGFVIVADSPYQELRFTGEAPAGIAVESDLVVRANTFSKTLGPGLRLGWAVLPTWLVPAVSQTRQNYDQHASLLTQRAVTGLLETPGLFDRIAGTAAANYRARAETLIAALEAESNGLLRVPAVDGGIFLWAQVQDPSIDIIAVHRRALAGGTDFQPGHHFDSSGAGLFTDHLRFGFTALPAEHLPEAAARVANALLG